MRCPLPHVGFVMIYENISLLCKCTTVLLFKPIAPPPAPSPIEQISRENVVRVIAKLIKAFVGFFGIK